MHQAELNPTAMVIFFPHAMHVKCCASRLKMYICDMRLRRFMGLCGNYAQYMRYAVKTRSVTDLGFRRQLLAYARCVMCVCAWIYMKCSARHIFSQLYYNDTILARTLSRAPIMIWLRAWLGTPNVLVFSNWAHFHCARAVAQYFVYTCRGANEKTVKTWIRHTHT